MSTINGSSAQFAPKTTALSAAPPPLSPKSGGTSEGGKVGSSPTDGASVDPEAIYEQKTEAFGKSLAGLSDSQRADVHKIHDGVEKDYNKACKDAEKQGNKDHKGVPDPQLEFVSQVLQYADKGLEKNPKDAGLNKTVGAGAEWVDAYKAYMESQTASQK